MSGARHTPGPWEHLPSVHRGIRHFFTVAKKTGEFSPAYIDIHETEAYLGDTDLAEKEANARRIAASPELLDALESLLAAATEVLEHPEYGAVLKARRVLAKATGKELAA